jgi:hypothetical protein
MSVRIQCLRNGTEISDRGYGFAWYNYLLTHSMQHSPSLEANRFSASQEIPRILRKSRVH